MQIVYTYIFINICPGQSQYPLIMFLFFIYVEPCDAFLCSICRITHPMLSESDNHGLCAQRAGFM